MKFSFKGEHLFIVAVFTISAFMILHAHFTTKLENLERAISMCESVLTPTQRRDLREEWEYEVESAHVATRDQWDR